MPASSAYSATRIVSHGYLLASALLLGACGTGTLEPDNAPLSAAALGGSGPTVSPANNGSAIACSADEQSMQTRTIQLLNAARALGRKCGGTYYAAAAPVSWNSKLAVAAAAHSEDMARHNFFSHTGSDGLSSANRVTAADYNWRVVGENIAGGQNSLSEAVDSWLGSSGHCANIMNPAFTEVAVSCRSSSDSLYGEYWTNVFGTRFQ